MAQTTATGIPTIGDVIRAWRKFRKLSSTELAENAGVRIGYLSEIEHNRTANPRPEYLDKLAAALEVPLLDIHARQMPAKDRGAGTTRRSKQRVGSQPTQKATSPGTLYHSPPPSRQEMMVRRLAVLKKKLETAEKNLHEAHEELRELGAIAADMFRE